MSNTKRMPFRDYQAIKAVNWSTLREMKKSPLHYKHRLENPREDTTRLALGRAAHTAVFEPDRFIVEYACFKGKVRKGKKWDAFKEQHEGETILKLSEYETCLRIRDAVRSHPIAASYLERGTPESTVTWTDPATSMDCKGRIDFVSASRPAIVDLKTTGDVSAQRFGKTAANMSYQTQMAFYRDGYMVANGLANDFDHELIPVIVIAVEAEAPYDVAVFRVDEDVLYAGAEEYGELLMKVRDCQRSGKWPGRYPEEQDLRLPAWAWADDESTDLGDEILFNSAPASEATAQEE